MELLRPIGDEEAAEKLVRVWGIDAATVVVATEFQNIRHILYSSNRSWQMNFTKKDLRNLRIAKECRDKIMN